MKTFDFFKTSKKVFSVKKFIKPVLTNEYYNSKHYVKIKDKKSMDKNPSNQAAFPMRQPMYPDHNKSLGFHDEKNHHFMYFLHKRSQEMEARAQGHIKYAKATMELRRKQKALKKNMSGEIETDNIKIHEKTGFMMGIGFDEYFTTQGIEQPNEETERSLDHLVQKLGYLDMRDFVALNKYILEAQNHEDLVNQTKAHFLSLAMKKLSDIKRDEMRAHFRKIDEQNQNLSAKERSEIKIEHFLETIPESKELFYKNYYQLKEINEREETHSLNQFEKYDKLVKNLKNPKVKRLDKDEYYAETTYRSLTYDLEDYMERMIKSYRDERTKTIKSDTDTILNKVKKFFESAPPDQPRGLNFALDVVFILAKYQTLIPKYKKYYTPTNMETERLINKYLREKRLKEFTKEKMMEEEDPNFSPLSDEEDLLNSENIQDEESKKLAEEKHQLKQKYFDAKFEYRKKKLEENIDKQLAEELGIVLTQNAYQEKIKEIDEFNQAELAKPASTGMEFIEKFLDDHYKSYKADYMYNYFDFFSNKYKVRRRIAEELKNRVSINEINHILNSLVTGDKGIKDLKKGSLKHSLFDFINAEYGVVKPTFIETLTEGNYGEYKLNEEVSNSVKTAIKNVEKKPLELTENEVFEMELYKGIKNDPYYKHYLYNHFAFFAETMNDIVSGLPHVFKGYKPADYIKYENMRNVTKKKYDFDTSQAISEKKGEMLDSLTLSVNSLVEKSEENQEKKKSNEIYKGMGKRKRAKAYAELTPGSGKMTVNGREFYNYFSISVIRGRVLLPLQLTETICSYDVKLTIQGGGMVGQADAAIPAISKALIKINPEWRPLLARNLLIKHDPRNVEPKKPGKIKARKGYVYNRR